MPALSVMRANAIREGDLAGIVDSADVDAALNDELSDLYELLVASFEDYAVTSEDLTVDANTDSDDLPDNFYKVRGVEDLANGLEPLRRFNWEDRKRGAGYAIFGAKLIVRPLQTVSRVYRLWFVPTYATLSSVADDEFEAPNRWHRLAELNVAARFRAIQDLDSSQLEARAKKVREHIIAVAKQRDAGSPQVARDVRSRYGSRSLLSGEDE